MGSWFMHVIRFSSFSSFFLLFSLPSGSRSLLQKFCLPVCYCLCFISLFHLFISKLVSPVYFSKHHGLSTHPSGYFWHWWAGSLRIIREISQFAGGRLPPHGDLSSWSFLSLGWNSGEMLAPNPMRMSLAGSLSLLSPDPNGNKFSLSRPENSYQES